MKGLRVVVPAGLEPGRLCRISRLSRGLTLVALARQLGRSAAWLSLFERGKIAATPPQVGEILAVLGAQFEHSKRRRV